MRKYTEDFRAYALDRAAKVGVRKAAQQLGVPAWTLSNWREEERRAADEAFLARDDLSKDDLERLTDIAFGRSRVGESVVVPSWPRQLVALLEDDDDSPTAA